MKKPMHLAIIMDGNGRWATERGLSRSAGHIKGAERAQNIIEYCSEIGIGTLSLFVFSTENWARPKSEINGIFRLVDKLFCRLNDVHNKIRIVISGSTFRLSESMVKKLERAVTTTRDNEGMTLNLCFNYGGRDEIVHAVNGIIADGKQNVSAEDFERYLYNSLPPPDMVIRTGDEKRISNFMLYQTAYSELYFSDVLWPDFDNGEIDAALVEYDKRKRKYGKI